MDESLVKRRAVKGVEPVSLSPGSGFPVPTGPEGIGPAESGDGELGRWLQYWETLTRHKLAIFLAGCAGLLVGLGVSLYQPPLYLTRTTLEFAQLSQRQPFEGISFLNDADPYLMDTQVQLLTSQALQARVAAKLTAPPPARATLNRDPLGPVREWLRISRAADSSEWADGIVSARAGLSVSSVRNTRIVQIVCESTVPQAAAAYANTLAREFIAQSQEERWALYQTTGAWLERAQEQLKGKLEEQENQLREYATANGLVLTSKDVNVAEQRLVQIQAEVSSAQSDRIAKEAVYQTAVSRPAGPMGEMLDRGPMSGYEAKLTDLRRELADATTSLTAAHPKVKRLEAQIAEIEAAQSRERSNILNRMRADYETSLRRERQLLADFGTQSKVLSEQDQKLIRYNMLQREAETYRKLYETTMQRGKEASVASALRPVSARVVDLARVPQTPYKPDLTRNLLLGLLGGLLSSAALVLLRDRTDASIRFPGAVEVSFNLRELGVIPSAKADPGLLVASGRKPRRSLAAAGATDPVGATVRAPQGLERVELTTWNRKSSMLAESFRATLTSILSSGQTGNGRRVILVTSPSPREGKSTVVTNLGIALTEIHQRVLLIDADMRRPRLHAIFDQANTWGLSDLLRDQTPCADYPVEALGRQTHVPGLFTIPSGPATADVSRLLNSSRMTELLERLRAEYDAVLIDTPPVLSVSDSRILSRQADAVVLVFRAGLTSRDAALMAVNVFEGDGVPVLGTVLNDWNPRADGNHYYSAGYGDYYQPASSL